MMTTCAILLAIHGLIHLLGAAKAFGWAELPQLTQPISPVFGALWLAATLLFLAAAVSLFAWPRGWWAIGAVAVAISTIAIVPSWTDAKIGALANAVVLVGVVFGFLNQGPFSVRQDPSRSDWRLAIRPGSHPSSGERRDGSLRVHRSPGDTTPPR